MKTFKYFALIMIMVYIIPWSLEARDRRSFSFLTMGGIGSSWFASTDSNVLNDGVTHISSGIGFNLAFNDVFSMQIENHYAIRGGKFTYDYFIEANTIRTITETEYNLNVVYYEIPLLFKFSLRTSYAIWPYSNDSPLLFDFFFGPYLGINLFSIPNSFYSKTENFRKDDDGRWNSISKDEKHTVPDNLSEYFNTGINQMDIGFIGGLGLEIELGRIVSFFAQGRFHAGFLNVDEYQYSLVTQSESRIIPTNNRSFAGIFGWKFKLWQQK